MKVQELIDLLKMHDPDGPVYIVHGMNTRDIDRVEATPEWWVTDDFPAGVDIHQGRKVG